MAPLTSLRNFVGYTVTQVTRENIRDVPTKSKSHFEPGMIDWITVSLERRDDVAVGDFLEIAGQAMLVVDIVDDALLPVDSNGRTVDAVAPSVGQPASSEPAGGHRTAQHVPVSRMPSSVCDEVQVRSVGPYSLITLMPLARRGVQG